jgi:hypothetical protein
MAKTTTRAAATVAPVAPVVHTAEKTVEQMRADELSLLAHQAAQDAFEEWSTADKLRKEAKYRTAAIYRGLRVAHTGAAQSPVEGLKTLEMAITQLAQMRAGDKAKQVMPNAQAIRTTYARALLHPMMPETDKAVVKGWILAGNALRSGAAESLYKRADALGVSLD